MTVFWILDLVIVVARTDPEAGHKGISLLVVERGMEGFERGRNLDKIGLHGNDTSELFFDAVKMPDAKRTFQNKMRRNHIVMSVRRDGRASVNCKN